MSYLLLLDSSDVDLTIGICQDGKIIYQKSFYAWQRQSEYMIPEIDIALKKVNISLKDIDSVALGIGPGSYTGIRIPLTIAKTLNVINKTKIIPLSSLAIMGNTQEKYIALMNARSNRSYIGIYENGQKVIDDTIIENEKIFDFIAPYVEKGFILKGDLKYLIQEFDVKPNIIDGLHSYALVSETYEDGKGIKPVYLKDQYASN